MLQLCWHFQNLLLVLIDVHLLDQLHTVLNLAVYVLMLSYNVPIRMSGSLRWCSRAMGKSTVILIEMVCFCRGLKNTLKVFRPYCCNFSSSSLSCIRGSLIHSLMWKMRCWRCSKGLTFGIRKQTYLLGKSDSNLLLNLNMFINFILFYSTLSIHTFIVWH